jgi:hypothetical protein
MCVPPPPVGVLLDRHKPTECYGTGSLREGPPDRLERSGRDVFGDFSSVGSGILGELVKP